MELVVVFPLRSGEVLLGRKKPRTELNYENLGEGLWNGFGGHVEKGSSPEETAIEELFDETGKGLCCKQKDLQAVAQFTIHSPKREDITLHVYLVTEFSGEARESEEMIPQWFAPDQLPTERWKSDDVWLNRILAGEKLIGEIWFKPDDELDHSLIIPWQKD